MTTFKQYKNPKFNIFNMWCDAYGFRDVEVDEDAIEIADEFLFIDMSSEDYDFHFYFNINLDVTTLSNEDYETIEQQTESKIFHRELYVMYPELKYINLNFSKYYYGYDKSHDVTHFCVMYLNEDEFDLMFIDSKGESVEVSRDIDASEEAIEHIKEEYSDYLHEFRDITQEEYDAYDNPVIETVDEINTYNKECIDHIVNKHLGQLFNFSDNEYQVGFSQFKYLPKSYYHEDTLYYRYIIPYKVSYVLTRYKSLCIISPHDNFNCHKWG